MCCNGVDRLDCEKLRKALGDASRKLSNTLLKNVVDTYRGENQAQTAFKLMTNLTKENNFPLFGRLVGWCERLK